MTEQDVGKELAVTQASMVSKGLLVFTDDGVKITEAGKDLVYQKWTELTAEDRILFGWYVRSTILNIN